MGFLKKPNTNTAASLGNGSLTAVNHWFSEAQVSAEGAVSAVHRAQETGDGGRGEHQHAVPVSAGARVPVAPYRRRCHTEQKLLGGEHKDVQRILYAIVAGRLNAPTKGLRGVVFIFVLSLLIFIIIF